MSFFDDAIGTIGKGLAQTAAGALSDATGFDIGGTLGFLFGDGQASGGANLEDLDNKLNTLGSQFPVTAQELTLLQGTVEQQGQQLLTIGSQLNAVQATVSEILLETKDIEQDLTQINQKLLFQSWQNSNNLTTDHITSIQSAYQQYSAYINSYSTTPPQEIASLKDDILNPNNGPLEGLNFIANLIQDGNQNPGLLQLWSNMVCALVSSGVMDYRDAVNQYMEYYKTLAFAQLTATNLLMEAYNYDGNTQQSTKAYANYKAVMLSQECTFIQWLLPIINAGIVNEMTATSSAMVSAIHASMQLNPNYSQVAPGANYYEPSSILYQAEQLLDALYCTDDADRRIVVHMTYFNQPQFTGLLNNLDLTLTALGDAPAMKTVEAISWKTLTASTPASVLSPFESYPDVNWDSIGLNYCVNRYVFSTNAASQPNPTLPDGSYQLTQFNAKDGLSPIQTYASFMESQFSPTAMAAFQAPAVLKYVLNVNEQSPFDFMNFLAYNYPYNA